MVTSSSASRRVSSLEAAGVKVSHKKETSSSTTTSRKPTDSSPKSSSFNRLPYRPWTSHSASHNQITTSTRTQRKSSQTELDHQTTIPRKIDSPIPPRRSSTPVKDKKDDVIKEKDELIKLKDSQLKESQDIIDKLKESLQAQEETFNNEKKQWEQEKQHDMNEGHRMLDELQGEVLEKDRIIDKLKIEVNDIRDSLEEMHQTHQTRLAALTQQLKQQEEMIEIKSQEYKENMQQLKGQCRELTNQLNETKKSLEHKLANEYETHRQTINEITTSHEIERDQLTQEHSNSIKEKNSEISGLKETIKRLQLKFDESSSNISNETLVNNSAIVVDHRQLDDDTSQDISDNSSESQYEQKYILENKVQPNGSRKQNINCLELLHTCFPDNQLVIMIQQHQKELSILKNEFQRMIDLKNDEINYLIFKNKSTVKPVIPSLSNSEQYQITSFVNLNYI